MKKLIFAALAALALAGAAQAETIELRFATSVANVEEPSYKAIQTFAQRVEERSEGRIHITILHGEQLGAQKKINEMIMSGAALMSMTDYGALGQFLPDIALLAGPYMYGSLDDAQRLLHSDVFAEVAGRLADQGLSIVMSDGLFGYRHLLANKPIHSPADMVNLSVRVPPSPMMLAAFRSVGARPTEIPWGEVYNALQSNVVDAAEAPYASIYGSNLQEVRHVVSNTAHQIMFTTWITSTQFLNSLPEDLRQILMEEGARIGPELTEMTLASDADYAQKLRDAGVEIVEDVDIPAFQEATRAAYDKVPNLTPGIVERMREAMAAK
jgi:tripartite ATP-independent transporter DctP family solute receptor